MAGSEADPGLMEEKDAGGARGQLKLIKWSTLNIKTLESVALLSVGYKL